MKLSEEVQKHIEVTYLEPAKRRGEDTIRVRAGDVHRSLRWVNRVPSVCTTLASRRFQTETGLELISKDGPPSGSSTTVVFTYRLPSGGADSARPRRQGKPLEALYGIAAEIFSELGGGENFLRRERDKLDFRNKEGGIKKGESEQ